MKNASNGEFYEKSTENLTNRGDAIEAIEDVHGPDAYVILREEGKPDRILRRPQTRRIDLTDEELQQVFSSIEQRMPGVFTDRQRIIGRVIDVINDVIAPHQGHVHANVFDFTGIVDVPDAIAAIERQEDQ